MKSFKIKIIIGLLSTLGLFLYACEDPLEPEVFSETTPDNLFNSLSGVESVLNAAHAEVALMGGNDAAQILASEESMTDIGFATAGAIANYLLQFQDWILDGIGSSLFDEMYTQQFEGIRNANILLENVDNANINDTEKEVIKAEARFIRAVAYYNMFQWFGPVPLRTSSYQELELPRAGEEEMINFIESELLTAIEGLPERGNEKAWGRAHKSAAKGYLTKLYLNTKQWQKCADMAKEIIDSGIFGLFPSYFDLFKVENERNEEIVWVRPAKADLGRSANISIMNFVWPVSFASNPRTGLEFCDGCRNFATMYRIRDNFWFSFHPEDNRTDLIVREYVTFDGDTINLLPPNDNVRPFKYWPGVDFAGPAYGNDIPEIRYADILLARAEALNELNGPNQQSIDLINQVRNRAGVPEIDLSDFGSTDELRSHILDERGWEFWYEGKRRDDLIRHGEFISRAQDRGAPAQPHHVRLPIPQFALDANPALEQNPGYGVSRRQLTLLIET